jgi:hypothetical protein
MMELCDTAPPIDVDPAEYARLLGYPKGHALSGRARELADAARAWFAQHGRPWLYARQCNSVSIANGRITLENAAFASPRLEQTLISAQASSAFLVAVSAGPEAEAEAQRLWREEKPDEYFFLEIYGSAVVEHLTTVGGARLCAWADQRKLAILPHYSPGYPEWDISEQPRLLELITHGTQKPLPQKLEAFPTGMLRPKKSLLAVFGVTAHTASVQRLTALNPCQNCSYARCEFRRAPYARSKTPEPEVAAAASAMDRESPDSPLLESAPYSVNPRALARWVRERLTLTQNPDGTLDATFRYDGTTCSNMGRSLTFLYAVKLGPRAEGYPLRSMQCTPAPGDEGHKSMCRYLSHPQMLMNAIENEKPLLGKPLAEVFGWQHPRAGPGCHCEPASREHKWALALETLHFALAQSQSGAR